MRRKRRIRRRGERIGVSIIAIECLYINLNIHLYVEYIDICVLYLCSMLS